MLKKAEINELKVALTWPENAAEFRLWFGDKVRYGSPADAIWQQIKGNERGTFTFYQKSWLVLLRPMKKSRTVFTWPALLLTRKLEAKALVGCL